jgi:hypothetical protein
MLTNQEIQFFFFIYTLLCLLYLQLIHFLWMLKKPDVFEKYLALASFTLVSAA